jgi:hypothetical protein
MGRGEGALDKAAMAYAPINKARRPGARGGAAARRGDASAARAPSAGTPAIAEGPFGSSRPSNQGAASPTPAFRPHPSFPPPPPPPLQMTDPHGNPNLLTAAADEKWKAIRKGVAVSFAFQNIKKKFPLVVSRVNEVRG